MLSTITITTGNGEFKSIELADATRIELSANSSLTFPRAYQFRPVRNVRLSGEAYFRVSHLARGESPEYGEAFTVNTDLMDVTVLGTEFNVRERRGVGQVALIKGGVVVKALRSGQRRTLRPGDIVKVSSGSNTVETEQKDAMVPGAWTEGKFSVNQTSVKDILTAFEDLYGYQVILDQPELANKKIDGSISIASEQGLLFTLSNILDVNVKKKGRVIRLEKRR
ncbi:FecR family protein [Pedobacter agri]|uniref:FecR family protein n=1 Tax=Pedobacter agri TaxID=454586 RepID=UPI002930C370|nr:FecR domain-containing protein [Pedobacter agri]